MDTTQALTLLPAKARKRTYLVLGCVALTLTAAGAFFLASPWPVPWVIPASLAAVGVLAGPFAVLAGNNVTPDAPRRAVLDDEGQLVYAEPVDPTQDDPEGRKIALTHGA